MKSKCSTLCHPDEDCMLTEDGHCHADEPEQEDDDDDDDEHICSGCNGSGEGMYDGSRCYKCHGTGEEPCEKDDAP